MDRTYIAIDLKSFYASVECAERGLDPLTTNLVVADASRTEKTICLAVSPSLKAYGISGRARLFEVVQEVSRVNNKRRLGAPGRTFTGSSYDDLMLKKDPSLELSYIVAPPRMACYMSYSTRIHDIYLRYVAPEDMHVYSIDEVFLDVTGYLRTYNMTPHQLAMEMIHAILRETGITATAGIGTNMYLCKIAMDIVAKKMPADKDGVRIAQLDEPSYRRLLWDHVPLTDFWRIGRGYAKKLEKNGLHTMGDIARCSVGKETDYFNEALLYRLFGKNAEFLIGHAWGWDPTVISEIHAYKPDSNSISSGQVLQHPYTAQGARLIVKEMADLLALSLVDKGVITDQLVITIGYDIECLTDPDIASKYKGEIVTDFYGRPIPKHSHGTINLPEPTSSTRLIMDGAMDLFDRIINPDLLVRRVNIAACRVIPESEKKSAPQYVQMDLFTDYDALEKEQEESRRSLEREKQVQRAVLDIRKKYGKNALLKGMNLEEGAMTIERNGQIGGHKA